MHADLSSPATSESGAAGAPLTAATAPPPALERPSVDPFRQLAVAIRWGAVAVGLTLAAQEISDQEWPVIASGLVLIAYTTYRTLRPIHAVGTRGLVDVLLEVAITVGVVVATGYWSSPFTPSLVTAVIIAGFARGFTLAVAISLVSALAVAVPEVLRAPTGAGDVAREAAQWSVVLLLVALVAGWARRISTESAQQQSLAMDRLGRLTEANALLYSLHRVAQTLPASLDLEDALASTISRLRELFDFDSALLLLHDDTDDSWQPAAKHNVRIQEPYRAGTLPPPLQRAVSSPGALAEANLLARGGPGAAPRAESGIYAALRARGTLVGALAVECREPDRFTPRDLELLDGFVAPAALAIDNARWFSRLRTVAADEERSRIARDLHDRIGQSLAYLAFELDRIVKLAGKGSDVDQPLGRLREDMRGVIGEVRDTLYDLRTEVSDEQSMTATLEAYLARVQERSGLGVTFRSDEQARLPLLQEKEFWRVAQEAITNVERHARARQLAVTWVCDGDEAELVVSDDGIGFDRRTAGRLDSYGLLGMRERAASLGARLDVESNRGFGTTVRCRLVSQRRDNR
ncbi:MAG: GAF domain-containing protein [Acidimicrobiales bacterium]|nr:GAF domain-containing protein [Acidimicrobiales bacterium]